MDTSKVVRPPCLKCGSRNVAWIQWGRPIWRDGLQEKIERNEITLGSCFVSPKCKVWECNNCGFRFGCISSETVTRKREGKSIPDYMKACFQAKLYPEKIAESHICGCYHCIRIFDPDEIYEWVEDINDNRIPLCPYCHQDAIIGNAHGFDISEKLLKEIQEYSYSIE